MRRILILTLGLSLIAACDDDPQATDAGTDQQLNDIAEGCKHFEFGPHADLAAAAAGAEVPMAMIHTHYTTTVPAEGGAVMFHAAEMAMYFFMLDQADATLTITDADGAAVSPQSSVDPGEDCAAAARVHSYMLPAGAYTLGLGGAASVELVVHTTAGGHMEHAADAGG